jgi:hypothetical protein
LRNSRRTARYFANVLPGTSAKLHFAHGLYVTLIPKRKLDESHARKLAADLGSDLSRAGFPLRHAGSFGFDFGATEWFHDSTLDRYVVRIAIPDLPTLLSDQAAKAIVDWWLANEQGADDGELGADISRAHDPERAWIKGEPVMAAHWSICSYNGSPRIGGGTLSRGRKQHLSRAAIFNIDQSLGELAPVSHLLSESPSGDFRPDCRVF